VSVVVGSRNLSISKCGVCVMISRSKKLTLLFCSGVGQCLRLLCLLLAWCVMVSRLIWVVL